MAKCDDCDATVVWLKRPDGGWFPPVEPVLDFADGEHVIATADGVVQAVPQIYRKHRCMTWEERQEVKRKREAEKQRLIEEDRERRREAARVLQEQREYEAEVAETRRQEKRMREQIRAKNRDREYALRSFKPKRLLDTPCRECGALAGEPCENLGSRRYWERLDEVQQLEQNHGWYNTTAHSVRFIDGPASTGIRPRAPRWGDDYEGPWPPALDDPGRYEMATWLAENFEIFDPDGYQKRDWLMPREVIKMTTWLRNNAPMLMEANDGPGDVDHE